ncbi:DUF2075 domain-containing protein [Kibdelosporangium aridum]|uniref:DUF2075 domain-containing protein n=2 Tax=Kibdelosporangium aridum TaxID=2030 RepID=A0A428Y406_KIBAR|nr:DUF2075 domain-containing protein [Kibdelosporangium aridum]
MIGSSVSPGEYVSWKNSLPALFDVLVAAGLQHAQVALEFRLPYSPYRIDAVICGTHPATGKSSYVVVELKQWEEPRLTGNQLVQFADNDSQPKLHPAEQVRRYCRHMLDFFPDLTRTPDQVKGMAYLHNAQRDAKWDLDHFDYDDFGQLYTADQVNDFIADLQELLDTDPGTEGLAQQAAANLYSFRPSPARNLLTTAAAALADRDSFVLLDDQEVAFKLICSAIEETAEAKPEPSKKVVVVRGGPGSGKSAIAMTLLAALARQNKKALHATGSKAFTETLRAVINQDGAGDDRLDRIFTYFNEYKSTPTNALDVLICDEAHRIRGIPENISPGARAKARDQIAELINAAKVPVFLLDDHQVIRPGEIGTPRHVVDIAHRKGCEVIEVDLEGQFRCGGSPRYDEWVRRLLGLSDEAPVTWSDLTRNTDEEYSVAFAPTPHALEAWLRRHAKTFEGTARIAAGFCWDWTEPARQADGPSYLVNDIDIHGWRRPWNTKPGERPPDDVPPASLWATDPRGFGQVGCVYTAQGFEYDWAGVIFGEDLVIRAGRWMGQPGKSKDKAVNGAPRDVFEQLIKNTYKVLLTRGMQGVCLYSNDPETNDFLAKMAS